MNQQELFEVIVISMLAVNNISLDRVYKLADNLRTQGFFEPNTIASWNVEETMRRLRETGYTRTTWIVAERMQELAALAKDGGLDELYKAVTEGNKKKADISLAKIKGVGPKVAANFWLLNEDAKG